MSSLLDRIAGAPITWGVDGSPGWGHLMNRDRVMDEMRACGLSATELGPDGYLPTDPDELGDYLEGYELQMVGGFVPALLYRPDRVDHELDYVRRASEQLASCGSKVIVLGASGDQDGYDTPVEMNDDGPTHIDRRFFHPEAERFSFERGFRCRDFRRWLAELLDG